MGSDYAIEPLGGEWFEQTAELLSVMWGLPLEESRLRLRWKYLDCPLATGPLVYVALCDAHVVAALAFFPSPFRLGDRSVLVLCPGDGFVLPEHRRHGLYTRLLEAGHAGLAKESSFFISLSANPVSAAGLLKIGWRPMAQHDGLSRFQIVPAARYLLRMSPAQLQGDNLITDAASIADLYDAIRVAPEQSAGRCFADPDRDYVAWRYSNPTERYVAIPYSKNGQVVGFAVCMATRRDVFVLDYRERPGAQALRRVVASMRASLRLLRYNWYGSALEESQKLALRSMGFRDYRPLLNLLVKRPSVPVLIHPTKRECTAAEWTVDGLDLSVATNWMIPELCNDGY